MKYNVTFEPSGIRTVINEEKDILSVARDCGVEIEAYCGSGKTCGKCKVKVLNMDSVTAVTESERNALSDTELNNGIRLSCATKIIGDVIIDIPKESQTGKQVIVETGKEFDFNINPAVRIYNVKLESPTIEDNTDDFSRISKALDMQNLEVDLSVLRKLTTVLRENNFNVNVVILNNKIIDIKSNEKVYGVAVDIGTTTIAAYLCDLSDGKVLAKTSLMNPQIKYGDDVLTRISYCNNENGLETLNKEIINGLNQIIFKLCESSKISNKDIAEVVVAANTVMAHIFLNINPKYIGVSPFILTLNKSVDVNAEILGIDILESGNIHVLPAIAGFVGADNVAVLIAEKPYNQEKTKLIIDIGTNSEICLWDGKKLYSSSCATGPALEGAEIKCGMRAAEGAIEAVEIDIKTLEPKLKVIGDLDTPIGICGSGIIDAVAQLYLTGIITPNGNFSKNLIAKRIRGKEYVLYFAKNEHEKDIVITQEDVRAVQLAKAALFAGAKVLTEKCSIENVDEIVLAGAFGSYIDKINAYALGMFLDCKYENINVIGNAAGVGAKLALLSADDREEANRVIEDTEFVETAADENYQKYLSQAMTIPHKTQTFIKNVTGKYTCTGIDKRELPTKVLEMGSVVLTDIEQMQNAYKIINSLNKTNYSRMPIMQNIETTAFGMQVKVSGNCYVPNGYMFSKLTELEDLKVLDVKAVNSVLEFIKLNDNVILDVECPFSILAALIKPTVLYVSARKNPELLNKTLDFITDFLINYMKEAIENGVKVISIADSEGALELVGEKFFNNFSGNYVFKMLKGIEKNLRNTVVHICPKTSNALEKNGYLNRFIYRVSEDVSYQEIIISCANNRNIKFIGHNCINNKKLSKPVIDCFELKER